VLRRILPAFARLVLTACGLGESGPLPLDPNEAAIARSAAIRRLAHGASLAGYRVDWKSSCAVEITVALSHPVDIDDDIPVTNVPMLHACARPTEHLVWHLTSPGVASIGVAIDRRTHQIVYIVPTWDGHGSAHWVGRSLPIPPGGD